MNPLARLGLVARRGFGRIVPEPFAIAVLLTVVVMVAATLVGYGPLRIIAEWRKSTGLWSLLQFTMQMTIMLVLGTALAEAPLVRRGIVALVGLPRSPRMLVASVAGSAIGLAILNWSLGLIGGALLAREAGRTAQRRGWRLHYPILCAAGYSGLMVWHGGLSGSAPLKATTLAGMTEVLGPELGAAIGAIPLSRSLFSELNLWVTLGLAILGPLVFAAMTPPGDRDPAPSPPPELPSESEVEVESPPPSSWLERFERSPLVVWALAVPITIGLVEHLVSGGLQRLDFDTVNLALWCAALWLHGRPDRFLRACDTGIRACTGIVLQFPLYAGIMSMMAVSGLSAGLARLVAGAGPTWFLLIGFLSGGLINLFVPSGGGQWAVQGPILMSGALELGVEPAYAMMAIAYGDQWTNMLQPFWALPLLAVTGVRARDIIGYAAVWMTLGGLWIGAMLMWLG